MQTGKRIDAGANVATEVRLPHYHVVTKPAKTSVAALESTPIYYNYLCVHARPIADPETALAGVLINQPIRPDVLRFHSVVQSS